MDQLVAADFTDYFGALYKTRDGEPFQPMNWQMELAQAACEGDWPDYICLPTGAGKTSTIDIAVFALAFQANLPADQRTAAMRTFLVVDRRTVVSEAFFRARKLQDHLIEATEGVLKKVADRLRSYTVGQLGGRPLAVVEMRGGIYRDRNWCNSLTQPMIVTSTVDQVGSRLLFRGYGVSNLARPIQAAAIAHDSLIILDEAHISPAFSETLGYVKAYQQSPWCENAIPKPLGVVEMTATPPENKTAKKLEIQQSELEDAGTHIGRIVNTAKVTSLLVADKVKGTKAPKQLAAVLVEQATNRIVLDDNPPDEATPDPEATQRRQRKVVGIMCNTVATAKETVDLLTKHKAISADQVHLIIGAMRPIDRDVQTNELRALISTGADRSTMERPLFVVATQCIEVGADYDFDVLVAEAAPLDSLVQRFGRLNRAGREFPAVGCIVMRGDYVKTDQLLDDDQNAFTVVDPIYGNSTSYTWNWLESVASEGVLDFGIASLKRLTKAIDTTRREKMAMSKTSAPVLLPAHLDMLCQTSLDPWPDPDVSLWLHGPQRNDPEVQVCWRADLLPPAEQSEAFPNAVTVSLVTLRNKNRHADLIHAVSLCPPTSAECLSVPLRRVVSWLRAIAKQKRPEADLSADIAEIVEDAQPDEQSIPFPFRPIAWRGIDTSTIVEDVTEIRPGDTLVFTPLAGGWNELGYLPDVNNWHCRDERDNQLTGRLQAVAAENQPSVKVNAEDFERLSTIDVGTQAFRQSRNRPIVRLHPNLVNAPECQALFTELRSQGEEFRKTQKDFKELLEALPPRVVDGIATLKASVLKIEYYANRVGVVITGPSLKENGDLELAEDDGNDTYSHIIAGQPIELSDHLKRVREETERTAKQLALVSFENTLSRAAEIHDWGKADPRFQALLLGGDLYTALWQDRLFAKSAKMPTSLKERDAALGTAKLPKGFRHEMLSLALAESNPSLFSDVEDRELLLHLIASHHGYARPWAPICLDDEPPEVTLERIELADVYLSTADRASIVYHRIDSSVPRRFWIITRRYGWWGTAMLESVLRLSDHRVSQFESKRQADQANKPKREPVGANA